jgi:hypothetical protein
MQQRQRLFAGVHAFVCGQAVSCSSRDVLWENEIFEDWLAGVSVFHSTDHIIVVPVGMISKSITFLTSQKAVYTTLLAEAAVLKFSVLLILFLSVKNFHSLMKVNRRHVVFRQEILTLPAVSSSLTYWCYGLRGYWHNAKPSCSRSLKFSPWSERD